MKSYLKIVFWIFLVLFAVLLYVSRDSRKSILTEAMYDSVLIGMDYEAVKKIIGFDGEEKSTVGDIVVIRWEEKSGLIVCTFSNGFVSGKTHSGLSP